MKRDPENNREDRILWERYRDVSRTDAATPCPDANSLAAFLEGAASKRAGVEIEKHLADCPACRESLKELRSLLDLEPSAVPHRVRERAKELVPESARREAFRQLSGIYWRRAAAWAAAAACVVAAAVTGMELGNRAVIDRTKIASEVDFILPFHQQLFGIQ